VSDSYDRMVTALQQVVVPALRGRGFSGSFPHFRRLASDHIDLITFQFDKWGGGFIAEIAKCPLEGVRMPWGKEIAPGKVTAHHVNERLRLGSSSVGSDHWFRFDSGKAYDRVAAEVLSLLDSQAEPWWRAA